LKGKISTDTTLKFYRIMDRPVLLYGNVSWTMNTEDQTRIHAAKMETVLKQDKK
jgi:hypothetical protein